MVHSTAFSTRPGFDASWFLPELGLSTTQVCIDTCMPKKWDSHDKFSTKQHEHGRVPT